MDTVAVKSVPATVKAGFSFMALLKLAGDVLTAVPDLEAIVKDVESGKMPSAPDIAMLGKLISDVKAVLA